ncbi:ABC transporter permease [Methylopila musalis]|uniref:ABC transporter permease n=1 Tax=Methylopila musalis TaxID=1134781 RepID=A0ABW3Z8W7_9HYPH
MRRAMNIRPAGGARVLLALLPFLLLALVYVFGSAERRAANPNDKLLPPISEMADTAARMATEPDRRSGEIVLVSDTTASLQRLALGLGLATLIGLTLGVAIGILPVATAAGGPLVAVISMIPPMAILPILFIVFGLGELSKVVLIVIGVAPPIVRDIAMTVQAIPVEQLVKAQTLGASTWTTVLRVALPQALPRLIETVRLQIGPAFLFLIAAEAIAADSGLGYRIFLVRRYLAMDVILPYVAWITLLAFLMDFALAKLARGAFPWAYAGERR